MKSRIKNAWMEVATQQKLYDEKAAQTKAVAERAHDIRQKVADVEVQAQRAVSDKPLMAARFAKGEITEAEFEMACPDAALHRQKLGTYREMLTALEREHRTCSSAQSTAKYALNDSLQKAWGLIARAEIMEVMPGLLRAYSAFSAGKIESGGVGNESTFAIELMAEPFKQYQQELFKIRDKFRKEYTR